MGIVHVVEALSSQSILASHLSFKMKWEFSKMCGSVQEMMSLAILISNNLIIHGPQFKEDRIFQQPEFTDEAVVALLVL